MANIKLLSESNTILQLDSALTKGKTVADLAHEYRAELYEVAYVLGAFAMRLVNDGAMTVQEIADRWNMPVDTVNGYVVAAQEMLTLDQSESPTHTTSVDDSNPQDDVCRQVAAIGARLDRIEATIQRLTAAIVAVNVQDIRGLQAAQAITGPYSDDELSALGEAFGRAQREK